MYNGWANYETWNVALWIGNDEGLYNLAKDCGNYRWFVDALRECAPGRTGGPEPIAYETPDGVSWNDSGIDTDEINEMIEEL
jgi:hypothetical protein